MAACGGPLAQADLAGSGVGFFGAVAVEDLLIELCKERAEVLELAFLAKSRVWVGRQK